MLRSVLTRVLAVVLTLGIASSWVLGTADEVWVDRALYDALWAELEEVAGPDQPALDDLSNYRAAVGQLSTACRTAIDGHFRSKQRFRLVGLALATVLTGLVFLPARRPPEPAP